MITNKDIWNVKTKANIIKQKPVRLITSATESEMNEALKELEIENTNKDDQKYLYDNWLKDEKTKQMWIKYLRKGTVTLDSDTNNNVETLNKQLKRFI